MKAQGNILIADEGYYLTKVNRKDKEMPMLLTKVYLSEYDSADNYKEVTTQEGGTILKEWEEKYLNQDEEIR